MTADPQKRCPNIKLCHTNLFIFSQGEEEISWCGDWEKLFSYGAASEALPRGQTEIEVIREWFVNIFQPVEKSADLAVTDFKFERLNLNDHDENEKSNQPDLSKRQQQQSNISNCNGGSSERKFEKSKKDRTKQVSNDPLGW